MPWAGIILARTLMTLKIITGINYCKTTTEVLCAQVIWHWLHVICIKQDDIFSHEKGNKGLSLYIITSNLKTFIFVTTCTCPFIMYQEN